MGGGYSRKYSVKYYDGRLAPTARSPRYKIGLIITASLYYLYTVVCNVTGHPNARLFITHGGMLGTQESIYHGVPLLGLPFGNDQRANVAKAVRDGWGLKLGWDEINDESLHHAVTHLINDPR